MSDYYYIGTAKAIGAGQMILVKTTSSYMDAGNVVEIDTGVLRIMAEVIYTSMVKKGSKDEAIMTSIAPVYEVEKIYRLSWEFEKKEEETEDGN
jgi:hypothetical protein